MFHFLLDQEAISSYSLTKRLDIRGVRLFQFGRLEVCKRNAVPGMAIVALVRPGSDMQIVIVYPIEDEALNFAIRASVY